MIARLPIRARLALGSAALTFFILLGFALVLGAVVPDLLHNDLREAAQKRAVAVQRKVGLRFTVSGKRGCTLNLAREAAPYHAQIAVDTFRQGVEAGTSARDVLPDERVCSTKAVSAFSEDLGTAEQEFVLVERTFRPPAVQVDDNGVETARFTSPDLVLFRYAEPYSQVSDSISRIRLLLALGVLLGSALAYLTGLIVARRAMAPIAELTETAHEIEQTRDPGVRIPHPAANDEVAELARTLDGMLVALDEARTEREAVYDRQRAFVADASHELRTPLTAVLANLELLSDHLTGDAGEAADSALRSTRRMRRLVDDLLLLARTDTQAPQEVERVDLGAIVRSAAAELGPLAEEHDVEVETGVAPVMGARDELHRLVLNLLQNAVRHSEPGTRVSAKAHRVGSEVVLEVTDDGPGIAPALRARLFERFARGDGDRGNSTGLGLAIVKSVAERHGGSVSAQEPDGDLRGARFVVRLPAA